MMNKEYLKIKEFTEDEIKKQILSGQVDIDFLCRYISKRDRVYNALIDRLNEVENKFILVNESNVKYYNLYCDKLKENQILRKNAEHNDKIVDKYRWENMLLKGIYGQKD